MLFLILNFLRSQKPWQSFLLIDARNMADNFIHLLENRIVLFSFFLFKDKYWLGDGVSIDVLSLFVTVFKPKLFSSWFSSEVTFIRKCTNLTIMFIHLVKHQKHFFL